MSTEYTDPFSIDVLGDTRLASSMVLVVACDLDLHETILHGAVRDLAGKDLVIGHRTWPGFRRGSALHSATLLAKELEFFVDPF